MSDSTRPTSGGKGSGAWESLEPSLTGRVARGSLAHGSARGVLIHRVPVAQSLSMRAISGEVEALLAGLKEDSRRRAAWPAS